MEEGWDRPAIDRWLRKHKPDVVISHSNVTASLKTSGWNIPEDFAYADLSLKPQEKGHISGIDELPHLIGEVAVDLVVSRLHRNELGLPAYTLTTLVRGEWCQGTTTRVRAQATSESRRKARSRAGRNLAP
jgi:hypothetical protein